MISHAYGVAPVSCASEESVEVREANQEGRLRVNEMNKKRNTIPVEPTVRWGEWMA